MTTTDPSALSAAQRIMCAAAYLDALAVPAGLTQGVHVNTDGTVSVEVHADTPQQAAHIIDHVDPDSAGPWDHDTAGGTAHWSTYTGPRLFPEVTEVTIYTPTETPA